LPQTAIFLGTKGHRGRRRQPLAVSRTAYRGKQDSLSRWARWRVPKKKTKKTEKETEKPRKREFDFHGLRINWGRC